MFPQSCRGPEDHQELRPHPHEVTAVYLPVVLLLCVSAVAIAPAQVKGCCSMVLAVL